MLTYSTQIQTEGAKLDIYFLNKSKYEIVFSVVMVAILYIQSIPLYHYYTEIEYYQPIKSPKSLGLYSKHANTIICGSFLFVLFSASTGELRLIMIRNVREKNKLTVFSKRLGKYYYVPTATSRPYKFPECSPVDDWSDVNHRKRIGYFSNDSFSL